MTVVTALAAGTSLFGWLNVLLYIAWLVLLTLYLLATHASSQIPGGGESTWWARAAVAGYWRGQSS